MTIQAALERQRLRQALPTPARRRLIREAAGVRQQELADEVGTTRETVSRWETGAREPRDRHLSRYVAALRKLEQLALARKAS